jgi:hypothetical protein
LSGREKLAERELREEPEEEGRRALDSVLVCVVCESSRADVAELRM